MRDGNDAVLLYHAGETHDISLSDDMPRQALDIKPHPLLQPPKLPAAVKGVAKPLSADMAQGNAEQTPSTPSLSCEQSEVTRQRTSPSKDNTGFLTPGEIELAAEHKADQSVPISQSAAATNPRIPDIAAVKDNTHSLNAAADQLQAVCRQLLQGLATPDDLKSSLDRPLHCADVRQYHSGIDVLAGLVSDLELELTSV